MKDRLLILMRHAKSSWANDSLSDFDRPLNDRGLSAAPRMGRWLRDHALVPDCMLCSQAVRAQQTANLMQEAWTHSYKRIDLEELYLASPQTILETIHKHAPKKCHELMVIGHNPGFENLASMLSGKCIAMPTAAVAIFKLKLLSDWKIELSESPAKLERIVVPRDIEDSVDEADNLH